MTNNHCQICFHLQSNHETENLLSWMWKIKDTCAAPIIQNSAITQRGVRLENLLPQIWLFKPNTFLRFRLILECIVKKSHFKLPQTKNLISTHCMRLCRIKSLELLCHSFESFPWFTNILYLTFVHVLLKFERRLLSPFSPFSINHR